MTGGNYHGWDRERGNAEHAERAEISFENHSAISASSAQISVAFLAAEHDIEALSKRLGS
jgi:hypothetical protein